MAEAELSTDQSAGSASRLASAIRLRLKGFETSRLLPIFILVMIFVLALFLRSFFAYDMASSNDWLMSGGSDSFYYKRLMDHGANTGQHLFWDDMLDYPNGARNPRPPLYTFSVSVPAVFTSGFFPSLDDAVGFYLIMSTAIWGALTVIPVYYITKEIFNRRTGYVAALFLAILPSHVDRSVATLSDHDSFALFLIVLTIYFFMKALKTANNGKWVEKWSSPRSVFRGLGAFAGNNTKAICYSLLAGVSFAAIAMAWVGYAYVEVILLAFFIIQLIINKFKGNDSTTLTMLFLIGFGFAFLITFPVYFQMDIIASRFDVPLYLFAASMVVGFMFSSSRDMPWIIVLPLLAGIVAVAVLIVTIIYPPLGEAIMTGQGYFSPSKLYTTIAEAKAPVFSQLAVPFGITTFFLSFIGLVMMLVKIPKRISSDYIIISAWLAIAIFMATSAARFMFNAAPAFAIASAWIAITIIDRLEFGKIGKVFSGASGGYLRAVRKSIKVRHIVGALFVTFMMIVPNIWFSLDAGVPSESKSAYDKAVYDSMPDFLKPSGYADAGTWYLGAFGYSLPLPTYYFPSFWSWFSEQDSDLAPAERPAYVSWWDYGFESIEEGNHPAVADNFQQGYQIGGSILLAQDEAEALGLMIARLAFYGVYKQGLESGIAEDFSKYGASMAVFKDVSENTSSYKNEILYNPDKYGGSTSDISNINILWRYLGVYFASLGLENEVNLYSAIKERTGHDIGYIGVDSRLLPLSASNTGVFYAPAKLTDHPIDENGNPAEYYTFKAVDESGNTYDLEDLEGLENVNIVDYAMAYTDAFYSTMLYRAFAGIPPSAYDKENDGLPSFSGSVSQSAAMPAWNMTHFMMSYRTVYFNPTSDASEKWRAISLDEGIEYQTLINNGQMEGVVDSAISNTYQAGVVLIEYFEGAVMSGVITSSNGDPAPDIRLTVDDKYGIPHQTVLTNGQGEYSLILPPGEDTITISSGALNEVTLKGANTLDEYTIFVTEDAAERKDVDANGDGILDWHVYFDYQIPAVTLQMKFFWDFGNDGNFTEGTDAIITNASYVAYNTQNSISYSGTAGSDGSSEILVTPGAYRVNTTVFGIETPYEIKFTATPGALISKSVARLPTSISGTVTYSDGMPIEGAVVSLASEFEYVYPEESQTETNATGFYSFNNLMPGLYRVSVARDDSLFSVMPTTVITTETETAKTQDFTLSLSGELTLTVNDVDGKPYSHIVAKVINNLNLTQSMLVKTDAYGSATISLPEGEYSVIATIPGHNGFLIGGSAVDIKRYGQSACTVDLEYGVWVDGVLHAMDEANEEFWSEGMSMIFQKGDVVFFATTGMKGAFGLYLPPGDYDITFRTLGSLDTIKKSIYSYTHIEILIPRALTLAGQIWCDRNGDSLRQTDENVSYANIRVTLPNGVTLLNQSDSTGKYSMFVPAGTDIEMVVDAIGYERSATIAIATAGYDLFRSVKLNISPVAINALVTANGLPLTGASVSFINSSRTVEFTTDSDGRIIGTILPGVYNVLIVSPSGTSPSEFYYFNRYITIFVGNDVTGLTIEAEKRIKVEGTITGVPSTYPVFVIFEGPTDTAYLAYSNYTAYLKEGTYTIHAYDNQTRSRAALFTAAVAPSSGNLDIALSIGYELNGRTNIGARSADTDVINVTRTTDGVSFSRSFAHSDGYKLLLPAGEYAVTYETRLFEQTRTSERYLLMTNTSSISLHSDRYYVPIMKYGLDNSTLSIKVKDQSGVPLIENIVFASIDNVAYSNMYVSDVNGIVDSTIHPGTYALYIADHARGLSYLEAVTIEYGTAASFEIKMPNGYLLTVAGHAQNYTDLDYLSMTIDDLSSDAELKVSGVDGSNVNFVLLPAGEYSVEVASERTENGMNVHYTKTFAVALSSDVSMDVSLDKTSTYSLTATWNPAVAETISQGESVVYFIDIVNTGNSPDTYTLSATSDDFTFSFDTNPVTLDFGTGDKQATVAVTITAKSTATVDHEDINIVIKSGSRESLTKSVKVEVEIEPTHSVTQTILAGGRLNTSVYYRLVKVTNSGNSVDNFTVELLNQYELRMNGWNASVDMRYTGDIEPGAYRTVNITYTAIRSIPNSNITAAIFVQSNASAASSLSAVAPLLPDLLFEMPGIEVQGDDVYNYDILSSRDLENLVLLIVFVGMIASIFLIRKVKFGRFLK